MSEARSAALGRLLAALSQRNYRFITPTPATHARVALRNAQAQSLRDIFGWSLPFTEDALEPELFALLRECSALKTHGALWKSALRISTLDDFLLLHSSFPTLQADAVFFGPDSYRFAAFLKAELLKLGARTHLVDLGAGAGVGGLVAARPSKTAAVTLVDVNPAALRLAEANIAHARASSHIAENLVWRFVESDGLAGVEGPIDCIIANPPFIADPDKRAYRDGGGMHGAEVSLSWARQAGERLNVGGALLLYTASAIVDGEDRLRAALFEALHEFELSYRELDPDVFGEELDRSDYADVERIAVVGFTAVKR